MVTPGPSADPRPIEIYVSYGLVKSGSTFAFELTKRLFVANGFPQPRLGDDAVEAGHKINFVTRWDREHVDALRAGAASAGTVVVAKTHARPRRAIARLLESGGAVGHAVYRDPRDMALSLLDAGRSAREKGRRAFSEIVTLEDAFAHIDAHHENFRRWCELPGIEPVDYATITADTARFAELLGRQTGLAFDHEKAAAEVVAQEFVQFNKGVQRRHVTEMDPETSHRFLDRYADFYDMYPGLR